MRRTGLTLFVVLAACEMSMLAQGPSESAAQQVSADLNQLMRGVLYPAANVVFFAQADNPGDVKPIPGQDPRWRLTRSRALSEAGGQSRMRRWRSQNPLFTDVVSSL